MMFCISLLHMLEAIAAYAHELFRMDSIVDTTSPSRLSYKESKDFMTEHVDLMVKTLDKKEFYLQVLTLRRSRVHG